jgi:hypothetical protein
MILKPQRAQAREAETISVVELVNHFSASMNKLTVNWVLARLEEGSKYIPIFN